MLPNPGSDAALAMGLKIAAISDTHGRQGWRLPECDVFIHAGDMTAGGTLPETAAFAEWLNGIVQQLGSPRYAIIVPGNHDKCFQETPELAWCLFGPNVHVLVDQSLTIEGVTFYGSPWTPPFCEWHFMATEDRLETIFSAIPDEVDVLITHGPPAGILDPGWKKEHAGSRSLRMAVGKRSIRHHVFGHLHGAGGQSRRVGETEFHNVSACNEAYQTVHQATEFTVDCPVHGKKEK